jgi:DnaJ-class molecular chaperone
VSVAKRLLDLARANLTDFREAFSADGLRDLLRDDGSSEAEAEDDSSVGTRVGRKAREFRDAAEEAWERAYEASKARARFGEGSDPERDRKRWYRTLELEPGADLDEVRRAYRRLLKQYHPDRFATEPEKQRAATEVTRRLTEAYNGLTRYLGG